jgi:anti-sigma factor RsiW
MSGPGDRSGHYGPELQEFLEGTLTEPLASKVGAHVAQCARCRRELDALRWVKTETRRHVTDAPLPPGLAAQVRAALDAEDARARRGGMTRRAWIAGGVLAAAAAVLAVVMVRRRRPLTSLVAADFEDYRSGSTKLDIESPDPAAVDAYFISRGVSFPTRVFDLAMMQYRLVGGRVHALDGRTSAMFAYRGPSNASLVCQMYRGRIDELPPTDDVRQRGGISFSVYRSDSLTLVFWPEGEVVCVLASDAAAESVIELAFAKALRVSA